MFSSIATAIIWKLSSLSSSNSSCQPGRSKAQPHQLEKATREGTQEQKEAAIKEYEQYAYSYSHSADIGQPGFNEAKTREGLAKAERGETLTNKIISVGLSNHSNAYVDECNM